ncbi:MAG: histidine triad nucleotide-binding protein [Acidimicrobiales bacterium]
MTECLFCAIIAGDVPSTEVLSTESCYAFRDINPGAPSHVLIVPRQHITDAAALGAEEAPILMDVFQLANQVARNEGLAERGYRLVFNVGEDSGNSVAHLHLHVLGGRRMAWPPG